MQFASETTSSSLVRTFGMDGEQVERLCEEVKVQGLGNASIAIKLFTKGHVVACSELATDFVSNRTRSTGGISEVLKLSGAFHSLYMSPAVEEFSKAVNSVPLKMPRVPTYSNITAKPFISVEEMKQLIVKQLTHCILWNEVIVNIKNNFPDCNFVECGPGRQLHFLLKKIDKKIKCINYSS